MSACGRYFILLTMPVFEIHANTQKSRFGINVVMGGSSASHFARSNRVCDFGRRQQGLRTQPDIRPKAPPQASSLRLVGKYYPMIELTTKIMTENSKRGKILIVDDNEDLLKAAKMYLKRHFAQVDIEKNPEALPGLLKQEDYDVILLDMNFTRITS